MVVMLGLGHVVNGVVLITHKAEHQTFVSWVEFDAIVTVLIGDGSHVGDFPVDVDAGEGLFFAVDFFVDGAFDDVLGKGGEREGQQ